MKEQLLQVSTRKVSLPIATSLHLEASFQHLMIPHTLNHTWHHISHTATLADLTFVTAKYHNSLHKVSYLAAQIQEAKLSNPTISEPLSSTDLPLLGRQLTRSLSWEGSENSLNSPGQHLFYKAASSDSLHSRSLSQSLSLSQEWELKVRLLALDLLLLH